MIKKLLIIVFSVLVTSCASNVERMNYNRMVTSNIGDPYSMYEEDTGTFPVEYLTNNIIDSLPSGNKYRVLIYQFDLKYTKSNQLGGMGSGSIYTYIAYAFENNKLIFFGLPEDYLKSENKKANEVGSILADLIKSTMEN